MLPKTWSARLLGSTETIQLVDCDGSFYESHYQRELRNRGTAFDHSYDIDIR